MSKKSEPYTVLIDSTTGEPYYASLTEIAALCERDEAFAWKLEHDTQDGDEWDYGY